MSKTYWDGPKVRNVIYENRAMFKLGNEFSEDDFLALFGEKVTIPTKSVTAIREALQHLTFTKLKFFTKVNKVLACRGLHITQRGTNYVVMQKGDIPKQIAKYGGEAVAKATSQARLHAGFTRYQAKLSPRITNGEVSFIK